MRCLHFLLVSLLLAACGNSAPTKNPPTPLVDIAHGDKVAAIDTGAKDASEEEPITRTNEFELPDECLKKMRNGRGMPPGTMNAEDGQLYAEALAAERAENLNEARKSYLALIQRHPQSPLVPHTYFAFGELFYRESQIDPTKFAIAEQAFTEVLKYPAPKNTALAFTLFRLAQLHASHGKGLEGLNMLNKLGALSEAQPDLQCVKSLGDSSRKLLATTFAEVGQPGRAFVFFVRAAGDRAPDMTNAFETLANLCDVYIGQQKADNAAATLAGAGEDHAPWAFCVREEKIIAAIASSIPPTTKDDLLRMHAIRCRQP